MQKYLVGLVIAAVPALANAQQPTAPAPPPPMSFFVTSVARGTGNLGGLAGADQICQDLAAAVGAGGRTWRAYLSTQALDGQPAVNARDRIGAGPWHNSKGVQVAANVADLHGDNERDRNYINKDAALDEKGNTVNGVGDTPNQHDIMTGSDSLGRALATTEDRTCRNWTSELGGAAMVGHSDRRGGGRNVSWNSSHLTPGCDQESLRRVGGAGRLFCFAAQ